MNKKGFAPLAVLVLLLAVVGLGTAVYVVGQNTGILNFARQPSSEEGRVEFPTREGVSLPVTEFGTIVATTGQLGCQKDSDCRDGQKCLKNVCRIVEGAGGSSGEGAGAVGRVQPGGLVREGACQYDSSGVPICVQPMIYPDCPNGRVVTPSGKDVCGCPLPPKCGGPSVSPVPSCIARPCCLDANPRCLIPERSDYCPGPNPECKSNTQNSYDLRTADGRVYHLRVVATIPPCESERPCPESAQGRPTVLVDLAQYVGKVVLVEGIMTMERPSCLSSTPPCAMPTRGWWPLPGGLNFQVKNVTPAVLVKKDDAFTGYLIQARGRYNGENVYELWPSSVSPVAGVQFYVRSSQFDLAADVRKWVELHFDRYAVGLGSQVDMFFNLNGVPIVRGTQPEVTGTPTPPPPAVTVRPIPSVSVPAGRQCTVDSDCNPCRPPRLCAMYYPDSAFVCLEGRCRVSPSGGEAQ